MNDIIEIQKLLNDCKYKEIIELYQNSNDSEILFNVLMCFDYLNLFKDGYNFILKNRKKLEQYNIFDTAKYLFIFLIKLDDNLSIKKEIEYYQNIPYINIEVEERISNINDFVEALKNKIKKSSKEENIDIIISLLKSDDVESVFYGLKIINSEKFKNIDFTHIVISIIEEKNEFNIQISILIEFLILKKVNYNLCLNKNGEEIHINPLKLSKVHIKKYNLIKEKIDFIRGNEKNISILQFSINILIYLFYYLVPEYFNDKNINEIMVASMMVSAEVFNEDYKNVSILNSNFYKNGNKVIINHYYKLIKTKIM